MKPLTWIALALCLAATACQKKQKDVDLPESGTVFTFRVEAPKEGGIPAMVEAVKRRLEAKGVQQARVEPKGQDLIRVAIPGAGQDQVSRIRELLTTPTRVAFSQADEGKEFFTGLKDKLPEGGEVRLEFDTYPRGDGSEVQVYYLRAADKQSLSRYLATLTPPAGRKLWIMASREGALGYLIQDPPDLAKPVITEAEVIQDPVSGRHKVGIAFDDKTSRAFAELSKKALYRRLAILVDGEIRSLPVVQSTIEGGRAQISPSPVDEGLGSRKEALALAAGIKAWNLAGGLTLVEHQVVKK